MDSRLDSKNLSTVLLFLQGSFATDHQTCDNPPGIRCIPALAQQPVPQTLLWPTHSAARHIFPSPDCHFMSHTAQKHSPDRATVIQFHPHPRTASQLHRLSGGKALKSFQPLTGHHSLQNQLLPFNRLGGPSLAAN